MKRLHEKRIKIEQLVSFQINYHVNLIPNGSERSRGCSVR